MNKLLGEFKLTHEQQDELLVSAKILDEHGHYHKDYFSRDTVEKSKWSTDANCAAAIQQLGNVL